MKFIADFHIHSKYSRATSGLMDLVNLNKWAEIKGIRILGTGDFTHPQWFQELKEKLEPAEPGLFKFRSKNSPTRFILTAEVSCIYSKNKKIRKIHVILFSPSFEIVEKINLKLQKIGNLKADGRPILGIDAKELLKIVLEISPSVFFVPAHAWTPWFSVFGSKSGFNSLEECFEELSNQIFSIETGLSSDPPMNWRFSNLDKITLISNSDAHSLPKLGREANVFNTELNYESIIEALKKKDKNKFLYTIEFFPEEGKYHYDGHRLCNLRLSPQESKKYNNLCPKCHKPLTIGVLNRVEELADRPQGFIPSNAIPFKSLIPLEEIIAEALNLNPSSKEVKNWYEQLTSQLGSEFEILLEIPEEGLKKIALPKIAEGILKTRKGDVIVEPGYDGVYGKVKIFSGSHLYNSKNKDFNSPQQTLF